MYHWWRGSHFSQRRSSVDQRLEAQQQVMELSPITSQRASFYIPNPMPLEL